MFFLFYPCLHLVLVQCFPLQRLGSVRGEDLIYILGMPLVGGHPFFPQNFTRQDMGVSEALLNFFSNFAKCGDPNGCGTVNKDVPDYGTVKEKTRYKSISWDPYEVSTQYYLSISEFHSTQSRNMNVEFEINYVFSFNTGTLNWSSEIVK